MHLVESARSSAFPPWPYTPVRILPPLDPSRHRPPESPRERDTDLICGCGVLVPAAKRIEKHRKLSWFALGKVCPEHSMSAPAYRREFERQGLRVIDMFANPAYSWLTVGLDKHLVDIELSELDREAQQHMVPLPDMSGFSEYDSDRGALICSYSKISGRRGAVLVPGEPPEYILPPGAVTKERPVYLEPEMTDPHIDRDERFGSWDPVFGALDLMNPNFRFDDIDIMADAAVIQNLITYCSGRPTKPLRFVVNMVSNTLVLNHTVDMLRTGLGHQLRPYSRPRYGVAFEKFATRCPNHLRDAAHGGHFRLIRHRIGPFACALRAEADAAYYGPYSGGPGPKPPEGDGVNDAAEPTSGRVIPRGRIISQTNIAEIKTNILPIEVGTTTMDWDEGRFMHDMSSDTWARRPRYFISAARDVDQHAWFAVHLEDGRVLRQYWQKDLYHQGTLRRLVALLRRVHDVVVRAPGQACILITTPQGFGPPGCDKWQKVCLFQCGTSHQYMKEEDISRYWDTADIKSEKKKKARKNRERKKERIKTL